MPFPRPRVPASRPRISAARAAWAVRCRAWRSSRPAAGYSRNGVRSPLCLGQVQCALDGGVGGIRVAERVPGERLQHVRPGPPESPVALGDGVLLDGGERGECGLRVALGKPQFRGGDADLVAVAVFLAEPGQELPGPLGLAQAYQGMHQQGPYPDGEVVRPGEPPGHRLAGLQRGQRRGVPVSLQLKRPADVPDRQYGRGLGVGGEGALGALDPRLGVIWLSLVHQHRCDCHAGNAGRRVAGPAVLFGQFHRLPAALGRPCERVVELVRRLVGQAGEFQVGAAALAGQRDAAVQGAIGVR